MRYFTSTPGILDTARNTREFVNANKDIFQSIFKPLIPYILGLFALDALISLYRGEAFGLGGLIMHYFYAALAISWHRVVLLGPDRFEPMNPFKPQKHELVFMLAGLGIGVLISVIIGVMTGVSAIFGLAGIILALLIAVPLSVFLGTRLSFYFPAKAIDAPTSLRAAFHLSRGYVIRLLTAPIISSFTLFLMACLISFVSAFVARGEGLSFVLLNLLLQLPILLYIGPLMTVIYITVLSNYYQDALKNR